MSQSTISRESKALLAGLNSHREHVLGILEGLPDEALRRPVLPSGWTCLGLVRHLAIDVERFWFRAIIAGQPFEAAYSGKAAWEVSPDTSAETVLELYRREAQQANAIIANASPGAPPAWWPDDLFHGWRLNDVREIVLHVIGETTCHAGHLDAVRELIDGRTWMVLT